MSEQLLLNKMHALHLLLADEIKRICDKHGIRYFIFAGTLLGSVRHKGFIPWDDDMDFGMGRLDFDRFLEVCDQELDPETFYLQTDANEKNYPFNFAKLRLQNTHVREEYAQGVPVNDGLYVDIFPVDVVPDNRLLKLLQFRSFWFFRNLLWIKCGYGTEKHRAGKMYKCAKVLTHLFSIRFLKRMKYWTITRFRNWPSKYVVTSDGSYGLQQEILRREWIEDMAMYTFEGHQYAGIADYDGYLSHMYRDYMKMPPLETRDRHVRMGVDLGHYFDEGSAIRPLGARAALHVEACKPCPCCGANTIPAQGDAVGFLCPDCGWIVDSCGGDDAPSGLNRGRTLNQARQEHMGK